jgi:hypothetical protein
VLQPSDDENDYDNDNDRSTAPLASLREDSLETAAFLSAPGCVSQSSSRAS